ncbi:MAG: DUF4139 domain-containing protein [Myxococcales bacterium]|nr:DUF4139 domain-containing protein [Myxococcales bacterium]
MTRVLALTSLCILAAACATVPSVGPGGSAVIGNQVLPVKRVVLFQNGVAYMERRGKFTGDELHLKVRPSQIKDILKSITVVDHQGGYATSLALPVDLSSEKALAELPRLALGQGALGEILNVIRGAWVRIQHTQGTVEGRMVGVEGTSEGQQVSILDESGVIRSIPRKDVKSVRILDQTLAQGLEKGLDISLGQESWQSIDLGIYLNKGASSERDLLVAYVVEMPTWKPSYRLVLDKEGEPLLQGWAIVDNVSGADWNDVSLTLTTGSPVSFLYDLYTPRFVQRPDLTPYQMLGLAPPVAESTVAAAPPPPPAMEARLMSQAPAATAPGLGGMAGRSRAARDYAKKARADYDESGYAGEELEDATQEPAVTTEGMLGSVRVQAQAQKVGSLYRYDLADPMTVPNRSSTMIALINQKVPGRAVYFYNPGSGVAEAQRHPFRAVSLENATQAVLEPGPIAIVRGGTFVGEGLIDRIEKGARSYIAYALDTAVNVTHQNRSETELANLVKISRGVIQTKSFSIQRQIFEVQANKEDGEAIPLLVGVPKRQGWEQEVIGGKLDSETATTRYLSIEVKPGEKVTLEAKDKYPSFTSTTITDPRAQQALLLYINGKSANPAVVEQLRPLMQKVRELSDVQTQVNTEEQKRSDLSQRARDIRANLELLKKSQNEQLKAEQWNRLNGVEAQLSKITENLVRLREKSADLTVELSTLIEKLEVTF